VRYECHNCGRRFEEPDIITETHGLESPPYEKVAVCPYCHVYFEEMYQCKICGEWFTDGELTSGVCDDCIYKFVEEDKSYFAEKLLEEKEKENF
jgi:DNA-directed RNA polymerase subunit RPC12/RpoP